jgi:hypothetical protein
LEEEPFGEWELEVRLFLADDLWCWWGSSTESPLKSVMFVLVSDSTEASDFLRFGGPENEDLIGVIA